MIFEDFKFASKTTKFYAKRPVRNQELHMSRSICYVKSGFQILFNYTVKQFSTLFSR